MRKGLMIIFLFGGMVLGQVPEWVGEEMERSVGTWIADNSSYMNAEETDDAYGIDWTWGAGKTSLIGELYGMKEGVRTRSYWQFFQFWDAEKDQLRIIQLSPWGGRGEGFLQLEGESRSRLQQTFVQPDGSTFEMGHTTEISEKSERSTSYTISEGEWIPDRTYIWHKQ